MHIFWILSISIWPQTHGGFHYTASSFFKLMHHHFWRWWYIGTQRPIVYRPQSHLIKYFWHDVESLIPCLSIVCPPTKSTHKKFPSCFVIFWKKKIKNNMCQFFTSQKQPKKCNMGLLFSCIHHLWNNF